MSKAKKLLLLEDDPHYCAILQQVFKKDGWEVFAAQSADQACQIAEEQLVDVAVLDIHLEESSGLDVLRYLRENYPITQCVMLTGEKSHKNTIESLNLGAFFYLEKPVNVDKILLICRQALTRSRAEAQLQLSEGRNRLIADSILDLVLEADREGVIHSVQLSQAGDDQEGDAYLGQKLDLLFTTEVHRLIIKGIQQVLAEGEPRTVEYKHKDESQTSFYEVKLVQSAPDRVLLMMRDITQQKEMIQVAERRRLYLEGVLTNTPDAIVTLDSSHHILEWNTGAEDIFGYSKDEVIGNNIDELIATQGDEEYREATGFTEAVLSGRTIPPKVTIRYRKDGSPVNVIAAGAPIRIDGELVGVVASYTDITEKVRIREALAETEQRYRSFMNNFKGIIYQGQIGFHFNFIHGQVLDITGYTEEELLAGNPSWTELIHPDDKEKLLDADVINQSPEFSLEREYRLKRKDGEYIWLSEVLQSVRDGTGGEVSLQGMVRDISEQKSLQVILDWQQRVNRDVAELSHKIIESAPIEEISELVMQKAKQLTGSMIGFVGYLSPGTEELGFLTISDEVWEYYPLENRREFIHAYEALWRDVLTSKQPVMINSTSEDADYLESFTGEIPVQSLLSAPVTLDSDVVGFITMINPGADYISRDLQLVMYLADIYALALGRRETEQQLRYMATHDDLTDLPNRIYFNNTINQALAQVNPEEIHLAVMLLDLDNFKQVNDNYGHDNGDLVLKEVARRLKNSLRKSDTIARWGGDEFVIIVDSDPGGVGPQVVVEKIMESLRQKIPIVGGDVEIGTSIGISFYPQDGHDVDSLIRHADMAMYWAKAQNLGYCYFQDIDEADLPLEQYQQHRD